MDEMVAAVEAEVCVLQEQEHGSYCRLRTGGMRSLPTILVVGAIRTWVEEQRRDPQAARE
jgi:hypothetical protein